MNAHERPIVTEANKTAVRGAQLATTSVTYLLAASPYASLPGSS